jgi:hypothetical protein
MIFLEPIPKALLPDKYCLAARFDNILNQLQRIRVMLCGTGRFSDLVTK